MFFLITFPFFLSSCNNARRELVEAIGEKTFKEVVDKSSATGARNILKTVTKTEIKTVVKKLGFNTSVSNNILKKLSTSEAELFIKDSKLFTSKYINEFNKFPDLIIAYKKLKNVPQKTDLNCLFQTKKWIENGSQGKLVIEIPNNINKKLLGHELNGVPFVQRIIPVKGVNFSIVVPDFSKFNVYSNNISKHFFLKPDKIQFEICRYNLRKEFIQNPQKVKDLLMIQNKRFASNGGIVSGKRLITDPNEMLEMQIKDILQQNSGKQQGRVFGFVWHHNEVVGKIDLVAYDVHNSVKHSGGRNLWAGGSSARKLYKLI
jgi:hypothetical protein